MPTDHLLHTLLRSLRLSPSKHTEQQLLATAASLLTTLTNPLNLSLLTSHLLSAPAIWTSPDGLSTCWRFLGVFQSAAVRIIEAEEAYQKAKAEGQPLLPQQRPNGGQIRRDEWIKSVLSGATYETPRWRHALMMSGLLIGFEGQEREGLGRTLKQTVESALVKAVNIAADNLWNPSDLGGDALTLALDYSFKLISDLERRNLDYEKIFPILTRSAFSSAEGYGSAVFLAAISDDVTLLAGGLHSWTSDSPSFRFISELQKKPLVSAMGPLARLIAHTAECLPEPWLVQSLVDQVSQFSKQLHTNWKNTGLSERIGYEDSVNITTRTTTLPVLWKLLRGALFVSTIILRSVLSRALQDPGLANDDVAPDLAIQILHILRHTFFISNREGPNNFSQHTFVYLTAIDILSRYPQRAEEFLKTIKPLYLGKVPTSAVERNLDLFFLNTAEHLAPVLSPEISESLLIAAATPYLEAVAVDRRLMESFEAAHSVVLSVLSSSHSADEAERIIPFYVTALFNVFPRNISARQFRLAFKTLLRICTPPSMLAGKHPQMADAMLEILHNRAWSLSKEPPRPAPYTIAEPTQTFQVFPNASEGAPTEGSPEELDEQTALTLALIDCLPFLPLPLLEEWLPLTAELIWKIKDYKGRQSCQDRFWDVLSKGEMDVERSRLCATWWGTYGGREMTLGDEVYSMSGALPPPDNVPSSKL